jgi:DNA-binding beta-propeller fold protein YncE
MSYDYSDMATTDPPDPNYKVIATPSPPSLGRILAGKSFSQAEASAVDNVLAQDETTIGIVNAMRISVDRAQGAAEAGDGVWTARQESAISTYAGQLQLALTKEAALRSQALSTLRAGNFPSLNVSPQQYLNAFNQLQNSGQFPPYIEQYFMSTGMTYAQVGFLESQAISLGSTAGVGPLLNQILPMNPGGDLVRVLPGASYGLIEPSSVSSDGRHVWALTGGPSVDEIDAGTGKLIQTISGGQYQFVFPKAISSDGTNVWVLNTGVSPSVTEMSASTGAFEALLSGPSYHFSLPSGISSDGTHVWVANSESTPDSVTEISASTGQVVRTVSLPSGLSIFGLYADGTHVWVPICENALDSLVEIDSSTGSVKTLSGSSFGFDCPYAVTSDGTHVWVANEAGNSVSDVDVATGKSLGVITGIQEPETIASDKKSVWVAGLASNSVLQIDEASGAVIQTISDAADKFSEPQGIASDGSHVWVANFFGNSITELTATGNGVDEYSSAAALMKVLATSVPSPVITSFSPTSGPPGSTITIVGQNLANAKIRIGPSAATIVSDSTSSVTVSPASSGLISVTTPGGSFTTVGSFKLT